MLIVPLAGVLGLLVLSAASAALLPERLLLGVSTVATLLGCTIGALSAGLALWRGDQSSVTAFWSLPLGNFHIGLDGLSAFFLFCLFLVAGVASLYGAGYLRQELGQRSLRSAAICYPLMVGGMATVLLARNAVLFLIAWEVMSLSSFFLVSHDHRHAEVRRASFIYLVASHLSAVLLFVLFAQLGTGAGSFDFSAMAQLARTGQPVPSATLLFVLAVLGFGTKAGLFPLHIWLPETYPAAPSYVSAVMSGAMSKLGLYGLLRVLTFLGPPEPMWAVTLLGLGAVSGLFGIIAALAQHELKRMIAYSSIENVGVICLGLGLGLLGHSLQNPVLSYWGFTGALLHVLHHGLMKSLLFLCASSVRMATGERSLDRMGGLLKRMPWTGALFLVGGLAISALPPLCGFVSEWLIYLGAFAGSSGAVGPLSLLSTLVLPTLALIGGLSVLTFVRAFGIGFLGQARTPAAEQAHEVGPLLRLPMLLLGFGCLLLGLFPLAGVGLTSKATFSLGQLLQVPILWPSRVFWRPLVGITVTGATTVAVLGGLMWLRSRLLRDRPIETGPTWGCGYSRGSPRMQYSATSFSEPMVDLFASIVPREVHYKAPVGLFPEGARWGEDLHDFADERLVHPMMERGNVAIRFLRRLQQGKIHTYLVYILVTLLLLLVWQLAVTGSIPGQGDP